MCFSGDVTLTANQCIDPDEFFNSTVSVLPETTITLTCSVMEIGVRWNSSQFAGAVDISILDMSAVKPGITFQYVDRTTSPTICTISTATITNIQEPMDGLYLTCSDPLEGGFTSTVFFDVIGKWKLLVSQTLSSAPVLYNASC